MDNNHHRTIGDIRDAWRSAELDKLTANSSGHMAEMLPLDAIRRQLRQQNPFYRGVQAIPLDLIVGSIGRYREFTRRFLPLADSSRERWANVETLADTTGWPPIDVYLVGGVYFANDGNHRVSVARYLEMATIEACVWEYPVSVKFDPDDTLDAVLIRLGEQNFMEKTHIAERFPTHTIQFTAPGRYSELLAQIEALHQVLEETDGAERPYEESVAAWYEMIYLPTVQIIRESTLLADFPGRTEADLYAWLSLYHNKLGEIYGDYESLADLAQILAEHHKEGSIGSVTRYVRRLLGHHDLPPLGDVTPNTLLA